MHILFIPALKRKSLKRLSFSYLGKAQKTFLSVAIMYAKNFLIHGRCPQALCYCSEVFPSPCLASQHSYNSSAPHDTQEFSIPHPIYGLQAANTEN